jgi:hypothetical protein
MIKTVFLCRPVKIGWQLRSLQAQDGDHPIGQASQQQITAAHSYRDTSKLVSEALLLAVH